jgi:hypothetical protein
LDLLQFDFAPLRRPVLGSEASQQEMAKARSIKTRLARWLDQPL